MRLSPVAATAAGVTATGSASAMMIRLQVLRIEVGVACTVGNLSVVYLYIRTSYDNIAQNSNAI